FVVRSSGAAGGFESPEQLTTGGIISVIRVADLDADGALDIVYVRRNRLSNRFVGCFGQGDGTFESCDNPQDDSPFVLGGQSLRIKELIIDDVNFDGVLDIVAVQSQTTVWLGGFPIDRSFSQTPTSFDGTTSTALSRNPRGSYTAFGGRTFFNNVAIEAGQIIDGRATIAPEAGPINEQISEGAGWLGELELNDLNRDGYPDLLALDGNSDQLITFVRQPTGYSRRFQRLPPRTTSIPDDGFALVNVDLSPIRGRYSGDEQNLTLIVRPLLDNAGPTSFTRGLVASTLPDGQVLQPLSVAHTVAGVRRLRRDDGRAHPGGPRLFVEERLVGLDPSGSPQSGIVVEFPLFTWVDADVLADGPIRLVRREREWLYAESFASDPGRNALTGVRALPRVVVDGEARDVYRERFAWSEIPVSLTGTLSSGSGERAVIVLRPGGGVVRAFVARDGDYQIVLER
ncbi:MAG: VCBS repeat-containing protein, partial [Myxococcota bacterium]